MKWGSMGGEWGRVGESGGELNYFLGGKIEAWEESGESGVEWGSMGGEWGGVGKHGRRVGWSRGELNYFLGGKIVMSSLAYLEFSLLGPLLLVV